MIFWAGVVCALVVIFVLVVRVAIRDLKEEAELDQLIDKHERERH